MALGRKVPGFLISLAVGAFLKHVNSHVRSGSMIFEFRYPGVQLSHFVPRIDTFNHQLNLSCETLEKHPCFTDYTLKPFMHLLASGELLMHFPV